MKTVTLLSVLLMLTACAPGLPELKYADGSRRIPINPHPISRPAKAAPAAPAAFAAVEAGEAATKNRCSRRKDKAAARSPQEDAGLSKWLFPIVH